MYNKNHKALKILIPLLDALNWKGEESKLKQNIVGFEDALELDDLIEIMATLNYKHFIIRNIVASKLDASMLPVLLVTPNGSKVILRMDEDYALIYDSDDESFSNVSLSTLKGDAISFHYVGEFSDSLLHPQKNWFSKLIFRFKKSFYQLTILTFFLTILDLLIPLFIMLIYDQIGGEVTIESLLTMLAGVILYFITSVLLQFHREKIINYVSVRMGNIISKLTFKKLLYLPPSYTETASVSSQINRIKDFENLKRFTNSGTFLNIIEFFFSLIYILAIFVIAGVVGLIPIVTFFVVMIIGLIFKPLNTSKMEISSRTKYNYDHTLLEIFKNEEAIKYSGMKSYWLGRVKSFNSKKLIAKYDQSKIVSLSNNLIFLITNASVLLVIYGGVLQVFNGKMSMGGLIGVILLYWKILRVIRTSSSLLIQINGLQKSILQINKFMSLPQETNLSANTILSKDIKGQVQFKDVSIRYRKTSKASLINVNFTVKNGEILGISGHDGAGKTTILKLIMAMYIPQGGRIVIDNWNIKQLDPLSLRQSIGYSPDNDKIFTGTIRQNILEFNPSLTDDAIHKILNETGLMTYMERLNITIDTVLSYEAIKQLSPSFRKLLSLSRCVARDTSIYLIDEPENHLNYKEINQVKQLISALREREKTVIVVTKSDSILEICDQVLYMNQGRGKLEKGVLYEKQA